MSLNRLGASRQNTAAEGTTWAQTENRRSAQGLNPGYPKKYRSEQKRVMLLSLSLFILEIQYCISVLAQLHFWERATPKEILDKNI